MSVAEVRIFLKEIFEENLPDSTLDKILELTGAGGARFLPRYCFQMASQLALKSSYHGAEVPDQVANKLICLPTKNVIYSCKEETSYVHLTKPRNVKIILLFDFLNYSITLDLSIIYGSLLN